MGFLSERAWSELLDLLHHFGAATVLLPEEFSQLVSRLFAIVQLAHVGHGLRNAVISFDIHVYSGF